METQEGKIVSRILRCLSLENVTCVTLSDCEAFSLGCVSIIEHNSSFCFQLVRRCLTSTCRMVFTMACYSCRSLQADLFTSEGKSTEKVTLLCMRTGEHILVY